MFTLASTEREYPWGTLRSTNSSKVKVVLEEKGIPYQMDRLHPGDLWKKPDSILARHPLGKVPYLETDEDGVVFLSTREDLRDTLDLLLAADDRIQLAFTRHLREIAAKVIQEWGLALLSLFFGTRYAGLRSQRL